MLAAPSSIPTPPPLPAKKKIGIPAPPPLPPSPAGAAAAREIEALRAAVKEITELKNEQEQLIAILKYFERFHSLPTELRDPEISSAKPKEITAEPARWGKGVGFGNVVAPSVSQQFQTQRIVLHDENSKVLLNLMQALLSLSDAASSHSLSLCLSGDQSGALVYYLASLCDNLSMIDITLRSELYSALFSFLLAARSAPIAEPLFLRPIPRRRGVSLFDLIIAMARVAEEYLAILKKVGEAAGEADPTAAQLCRQLTALSTSLRGLRPPLPLAAGLSMLQPEILSSPTPAVQQTPSAAPPMLARVCATCQTAQPASRCSRCFSVPYCSKECQIIHLPEHKRVCAPQSPAAPHQPTASAPCAAPQRMEISVTISSPLPTPRYEEVMRDQLMGNAPIDLTKHFWQSTFKSDGLMPKPKMTRLLSELGSFAHSLPLQPESSIFVCCDANRMDVLKALIIGPEGTPYENGCFIFDLFLPSRYPNVPPKCQLRTTGGGTVRFNPNLYQCGKVCLSLLGTWQGEPWGPQSTLLQLLVSIQSLILVPHPYFNEPGWEASQGTENGARESKKYNDERLAHTLNHAMSDHLDSRDDAFGDVIAAHLYLRRAAISAQMQRWLESVSAERKPALQSAADRLRTKLASLEKDPPMLVRRAAAGRGM